MRRVHIIWLCNFALLAELANQLREVLNIVWSM